MGYKKVLITGGAGFIGSNLGLYLVDRGYEVTVLDNLSEQIHGADSAATSPLYISIKDKVNFIKGGQCPSFFLYKIFYIYKKTALSRSL